MHNNNQPKDEFLNPFTKIYDEIIEVKTLLKRFYSLQSKTTESEVERILNVKETSVLISFSIPSIYRLCNENKLPHFKRGNKLLFKQDELIAWLNEGRRKTVREIAEEVENNLEKLGQKKC